MNNKKIVSLIFIISLFFKLFSNEQELQKYYEIPDRQIENVIKIIQMQITDLKMAPEGSCRWSQVETERQKKLEFLERALEILVHRTIY